MRATLASSTSTAFLVSARSRWSLAASIAFCTMSAFSILGSPSLPGGLAAMANEPTTTAAVRHKTRKKLDRVMDASLRWNPGRQGRRWTPDGASPTSAAHRRRKEVFFQDELRLSQPRLWHGLLQGCGTVGR